MRRVGGASWTHVHDMPNACLPLAWAMGGEKKGEGGRLESGKWKVGGGALDADKRR
jgi:hypothetical protein